MREWKIEDARFGFGDNHDDDDEEKGRGSVVSAHPFRRNERNQAPRQWLAQFTETLDASVALTLLVCRDASIRLY